MINSRTIIEGVRPILCTEVGMKDYKKILQLDSEGKSKNEISQCLGYQWRTVNDILKKAEEAKVTYEQAKLLDNRALQKRINKPRKTDVGYLEFDLEYLHRELADPHVTMQQLYDEYQQQAESLQKKAYSKSQFSKKYQDFTTEKKVSGHVKSKPGKRLELDFAGDVLSYFDRSMNKFIQVVLFVATLSFSKLVYVEAILNQGAICFALALKNALDFFRGQTTVVVVDNTKAAIILHVRYEVAQLHSLMEDMSRHYGFTVVAAPPRKPKFKNVVEASVHYSYIDIIAPLRHNQYYSLETLNEGLWVEMGRFNGRPFQEHPEWTRASLFLHEEAETLRALPDSPYEVRQISKAQVRKNSHVKCKTDGYYYSVPFHYMHQQVFIKLGRGDVQIYEADGDKIGPFIYTHPRGSHRFDFYVTENSHLPSYIVDYVNRDENQLLYKAGMAGPSTYEVVRRFFDHAESQQEAPEKYYETCAGVVHLSERKRDGRRVGEELLEEACSQLCIQFPSHAVLIRYTRIKQKLDDLCERQEKKARAEDLRQLLFEPDTFMDAELGLGFGEGDDEQ
ncbi:MAG: transposase [Bacteroidia bacterium]|nr:transposase [Bacteroidia bacterium]